MKPKQWKQHELDFLKIHYKEMNFDCLATIFNCTKGIVAYKAKQLGLIQKFPINIKEKFNKLTVLKISENKYDGRKKYICQCDCGQLTEVLGNHLRRGVTQSCGCYNIQRTKETQRLPIGESALNEYERIYKSSTKITKRSYELTREQFRMIISKNCFYCNSSPRKLNPFLKKDGSRNKKQKTNTLEWAQQQFIFVNGIDRKNNADGYILENCLPCCTICNHAKHTLDYMDFISYLDNLVKYRVNL